MVLRFYVRSSPGKRMRGQSIERELAHYWGLNELAGLGTGMSDSEFLSAETKLEYPRINCFPKAPREVEMDMLM
jgi:hypothetical protein